MWNRIFYFFRTILAPPMVRLPQDYEEGLLLEQNEPMRLKVSVSGRPLPEVAWLHDGVEIRGGDRWILYPYKILAITFYLSVPVLTLIFVRKRLNFFYFFKLYTRIVGRRVWGPGRLYIYRYYITNTGQVRLNFNNNPIQRLKHSVQKLG